MGREAGADDADIDGALERAGEGALKCLKEKKDEPAADEGDDEQQAVALAQEDLDLGDAAEVVEAVVEMSDGEKEELVARVKEEGKGDELMDALRKKIQEASGEEKEALKAMVEQLVGGDKPEGRQGKK